MHANIDVHDAVTQQVDEWLGQDDCPCELSAADRAQNDCEAFMNGSLGKRKQKKDKKSDNDSDDDFCLDNEIAKMNSGFGSSCSDESESSDCESERKPVKQCISLEP